MPARAAPRLGRIGPGLRLLTHNVNGLREQSHVHALMRMWCEQKAACVCLQETHLSVHTQAHVELMLTRAAQSLACVPYVCFWAHNTQAGSGRSTAGVGILIRADLLSGRGGPITLKDDTVQKWNDGRCITLQLQWAAHDILLCNCYLPCLQHDAQRGFIVDRLGPILAAARGAVLVAGDFNFVEDTQVDRLHHGHGHDNATARTWKGVCKGMHDCFRLKHANTRSFTYLKAGAGSRLDRWYCSDPLCDFVQQCHSVGTVAPDHRPVVLHLRQKNVLLPKVSAPMVHVRLGFLGDAEACAGFEEDLMRHLAQAPLQDSHAMLLWWPSFKKDLVGMARRAQAAARARWAGSMQRGKEALASVESATDSYVQQPSASHLATMLAARWRFIAAARSEAREAAVRDRFRWLHSGERPSPLITRLTQPPRDAHTIATLKAANGGLLTAPHAIAGRVAQFFAEVSARKPSKGTAQQQLAQEAVLQAVHQHAARFTASEAQAMGDSSVTEAQIRAAMRHLPSGKAPGLDGIPVQLYRRFAAALLPVLSALYTAIGTLQQTPPGFLMGALKPLPKKGDPADPANKRPITLLNTDYRILTRILAHRVGGPFSRVASLELSAFLPGRCIGDGVLMLQLLPALLKLQGSWKVYAMLDFQKAYDTVDRDFLYMVMQCMGAGSALVGWVRTLLADTRAVAVVNNVRSQPVVFEEGVRQGCPLSPALYLFVASALHCWFVEQEIRVEVGGRSLSANQYADDATPVLPSLCEDCVSRFLNAMHTFGLASGQCLNMGKTVLVPVGAVPPGVVCDGMKVCGLKVVDVASTLGVLFGDNANVCDANQKEVWTRLMSSVESCYARVQKLGMSMFGRAFSSATYGVSKLLYQCEFSGMPSDDVLKRMHCITAALVDRNLAPDARGKKPPGVRSCLLPGTPLSGGFGVMPWQQHVWSRHAKWGAALAAALMGEAPDEELPPWVHVAKHVIMEIRGYMPIHPALMFLMHQSSIQAPWHLAGDALQRLRHGVMRLGAVCNTRQDPPDLGPWCASMPLWCNPMLVPRGHAQGTLLENVQVNGKCVFKELINIVSLWTIGDAIRIWHVVHNCPMSVSMDEYVGRVWVPEVRRAGLPVMPEKMRQLVVQRAHVHQLLTDLVLFHLPADWGLVAQQCMQGSCPSMHEVVGNIVGPRLGWVDDRDRVFRVIGLRVKDATHVQLGPVRAQRRKCHQEFVASALGMPIGHIPPAQNMNDFYGMLRACWKLRWENKHKEVVWRLSVGGTEGVRADEHVMKCCLCEAGVLVCDVRKHMFWECMIAKEVRRMMQTSLPSTVQVLTPAHVWLMQRPNPDIHVGVWRVVCMAALNAMWHGHKCMMAMHGARVSHEKKPRQMTLYDVWGLPSSHIGIVVNASRMAIARFWSELQDFVQLVKVPKRWIGKVGANHPFVAENGSADLVLVK